ncbi:MAG: hypothetical protein PHE55_09145 [Methylococcaceae bacterium]|nr:hypothetical protein [Methylococcaceae bacterium]
MRAFLLGGLLLAGCAPASWAANLWSIPTSYLGTGYFFGPGAYMTPTPLFPVMIRNMAFTSTQNFVTPFWNNGAEEPNVKSEKDFPPVDGLLSDGTRINENVDLGTFTLAGTRFLPAVGEGGEFFGQQQAMTSADGNVTMVMDLVLDLGIGPKGVIRLPFHGTTGTLAIPGPLTNPQGASGASQAGPLKTGETISGRIGDFNGDGFIDGTLVAVGVMPLTSPVYPGQPFAMSRNFETDIPIDGAVYGSPGATNKAYGLAPGDGFVKGSKR